MTGWSQFDTISLFGFKNSKIQRRRILRSVDIVFDNNRVLPGETLTGSVIVKTDETFDCNRIVLKVLSRERTEYGSGDDRHVDTKQLVSRVFRISEGRTIPEGTTSIPFSYTLPRGLPPSYRGHNGNIKHDVEGVVEVDWALDPKMTREYLVLQNRPPYIPEIVDASTPSESVEGLRARLDNNILRMDTGILARFNIDDKKRIRGVRFDIVKRENAKCGWRNLKNDSSVRKKFIELGPDDWGRWQEIQIGEEWRYHLPFESLLFQVSYHLKVTLEIGWELDPSIFFPLRFSDFAPEKDVLDEIALDLGLEGW